MRQPTRSMLGAAATLLLSGFLLSQGQETAARRPAEAAGQAVVEHPECSFFVNRDKFTRVGVGRHRPGQLTALTRQVTSMLSAEPTETGGKAFANQSTLGT